ncbi:MAG: iron-containing redox enzyme family protein [Pseudomonadota bacterium]
MQSLLAGELTQEEYRSVLRQVYHHTRENPQLQALATVYFRGRQRDLVRAFFSHAASEIGHDQLALNDFVTLGGDPSTIPYENPLPDTSALLAYGFYQIYNLNPLGYLGYLFFLEFNGTGSGPLFRDALTKIGVPQNAMTFLQDHMEIDVGHNKLMERYVADLSLSRADIDAIKYSMAVTGRLYAHMLDAAVRDAREGVQTGWNWEELNADGLTPERIPADGAGVRRDGARLSAAKVA